MNKIKICLVEPLSIKKNENEKLAKKNKKGKPKNRQNSLLNWRLNICQKERKTTIKTNIPEIKIDFG